MCSQTYLLTDKMFYQKSSRMYLCTLHSSKWWMDNANTEQMVGGVRLRIKIKSMDVRINFACFCSVFVSNFNLDIVMCYLIFLTQESVNQCQHQNSPVLFCMKLFIFPRSLAILDRFFEFPIIIIIIIIIIMIFSSTHARL